MKNKTQLSEQCIEILLDIFDRHLTKLAKLVDDKDEFERYLASFPEGEREEKRNQILNLAASRK